jgi:hypothetical protein
MFDTDEVISILKEKNLPVDITIIRDKCLEDKGRYSPEDDTIRIGEKADKWTVLHEGTHAKHYRKLHLVKKPIPKSESKRIGLLFIAEAFIGYQLGKFSGFIESERNRLSKLLKEFKTLSDWGNRYDSGEDYLSRCMVGKYAFIDLYVTQYLMLFLPLIAAERVSGTIVFGDLKSPAKGISGKLRQIALKACMIASERSKCFDLDKIGRFGKFVIDFYRKNGVNWVGIQ